mgnify:CR=1 FL=1
MNKFACDDNRIWLIDLHMIIHAFYMYFLSLANARVMHTFGRACLTTPPPVLQKIGANLATSTRVGLTASGSLGEGESCLGEWRFCLKPFSYRPVQSAPFIQGTYGAPFITATPGQRYKITVPRLQANGQALTAFQLTQIGAEYTCNLSFDSQKKFSLAYC